MHMLIAGTSYFPQYTAGTEVYMRLLAKALKSMGHSVSIACGGDCTTPLPPLQKWGIEELSVEEVDVFRFVRNSALAEITDHYGRVDQERFEIWRKLITRLKPDIVLVVGRGPAVMGDAEVIAKANLIPVIWTLIHPDQLCPKGPRIDWQGRGCMEAVRAEECSDCILRSNGVPGVVSAMARQAKSLRLDRFLGKGRVATCLQIPDLVTKYLERWKEICDSVDLFVAHSEAAQQLLLVNGIAEERILFSTPGFDADDRESMPARKATSSEAIVRFGFVGRLCAQKGVETLVNSWHQIAEDLQCTLQFWGDPQFGDAESVAAVRRLAARDSRVTLRGGFSRSQLADVYGSIDVLIVPSEWFDNCPFVISEAFLFGIPVIGADFGGISTMVKDGHNGWLFQMKDSSSLARIVVELTHFPKLISSARQNVTPPRSFTAHAAEIVSAAARMIAPTSRLFQPHSP
jgi:glycosyltransferase involved in cell wall biosynthesis